MVNKVNKKPSVVCSVREVPMMSGRHSSVTQAENWAESATTAKPQIAATITSGTGLPPKRKPMVRAMVPLITSDAVVTAVRPRRSASRPAIRLPGAPAAMTARHGPLL